MVQIRNSLGSLSLQALLERFCKTLYLGVVEISTPSGNMVRLQNGLIKFAAVIVVGGVIYVCSYDPCEELHPVCEGHITCA